MEVVVIDSIDYKPNLTKKELKDIATKNGLVYTDIKDLERDLNHNTLVLSESYIFFMERN